MPTWLYVAFWIIWIVLTAEQMILEILITHENKNKLNVLLYGVKKQNARGVRHTLIWFLFTVFWLSYVFVG